ELIITASPTDASSASWINKAMGGDLALVQAPIDRLLRVQDFLEAVIGHYRSPLMCPAELLTQSTSGHNEVAVLGSNGS
ncbi:hypothetical protein OFN63_41005, partial [Escherichia coli]|nr:hypothetical protein [Escherichia coli]